MNIISKIIVIKKNQIFQFVITVFISIFVASFSIRYFTLSLGYFLSKSPVLTFFNQKNILFPNSRVFTAENNKYSALLGYDINIKIAKDNGEFIYLDNIYVNNFNHAYNKVLSNITLQYFSQSNATKSNKERAAIYLFCKKNYTSIEIERILTSHSQDMYKKNFDNKIQCN